MKHLDLFSGIGGFSLGLERAGMQTVAFCEIDPYCRQVLRKHWPNVKIYEDVRILSNQHLTADGIGVDIIAGGFPCQDVSEVGGRAGIEGEQSGLWTEMARLVCEIRPRFVIVENVTGLLNRGMSDVLRDLAAIGYDAEWSVLSACRLGAPHSRERVFLVAYPNEQRQEAGRNERDANGPSSYVGPICAEHIHSTALSISSEIGKAFTSEPEMDRVADGIPDRVDALAALGNSIIPQIPEIIGRAIMSATPHDI